MAPKHPPASPSQSSTTPEPRPPQCPSLPPEIWIRILSHHTDLTHLWTTCRLISRTFQAYVEQVFALFHLRDLQISFSLEKYNLGGTSRRPEVTCIYSRFAKDRDKSMVYFKDEKSANDWGPKEKFALVMGRWAERIKSSCPQLPSYTIGLGGVVNDTQLPELSFDPTTREIVFEWRGMFTMFFREQARLRELKTRWEADTSKKLEENRLRLSKGEKLSVDDLPKSWATTEVELKKHIRRARLQEHFEGDEEMVWAFGSLRYFEDYSKAAAPKLLPDIPETGVGEKWFGSMQLLQQLYLDEWSCMHRIDTKREHLAQDSRK